MNPEKIADSFSDRVPRLDWSSLMTGLYQDLEKAEHELRLIHMSEVHRNEARIQLDKAMIGLRLLRGWCDG